MATVTRERERKLAELVDSWRARATRLSAEATRNPVNYRGHLLGEAEGLDRAADALAAALASPPAAQEAPAGTVLRKSGSTDEFGSRSVAHASPAEDEARKLIDAILAERADDLTKEACDACEQCGRLVMCSYHSVLSALAGHTSPSYAQAPPASDPPGLPRYGVTWQEGVSSPLLTPMADGYWTPWHLAAQAIAARQSDPPGLVANWRPIETAPKRTDVLAGWADRPHWLPQVLQQDDAGMWFNGEESDYRPPTHWMPLPASPQAKED